jgi:hypothetical protein
LSGIVRLLMVLVLLAGAVGAFLYQRADAQTVQRDVQLTADALEQIQQRIKFQSALGQTTLNGRGWPVSVDPAWFNGTPPMNALIPPGHPWLEIATPDQYGLRHPPQRQAVTRQLAGFWYNPGNGIVRARVGPAVSDAQAIEQYNRINGARVHRLFDGNLREPLFPPDDAPQNGDTDTDADANATGDAHAEGDVGAT